MGWANSKLGITKEKLVGLNRGQWKSFTVRQEEQLEESKEA